ncbi:ATP-binding protein [Propionimicrobium sp. BV2F7]|uniref:ATP-binding protein n=1 Tax=Propionimicrobium TaxID=203133 RepID=UPI0003D79824|nr:ATP-binding protein [Propionimicrobium sp. BV2F7]ETJ96993.1 PF13635 domain protein [Propionimicrobium sp. BV2F7]
MGKAINALRVSWNCDIYLTGSNSKMLSGDLATNLAGRYIEFRIQPLSFGEFNRLYPQENKSETFINYIRFGGMPGLKYFDFQREPIIQYLQGLYDSTVLKDVVEHNAIRDVDLFSRTTRYAFANIGTTFSASSIAKFLKNERRTASVDTILDYLEYCSQAFLLDRVNRFDVKGKAAMQTKEKYSCADHGYRLALGLSNESDIELVLENIVYQELRSRGYEVRVGKVGSKEIDFVAKKDAQISYYQVSYLLASQETPDREFSVFENVSDNYPKQVLSMDSIDLSRDGIVHKSIIDFLLEWR